MEKELRKAAVALLGVSALCPAMAAAQGSASPGTSPEVAAASVDRQCRTVTVKKRVRRWVWVVQTRKVHGHRVVVRVHGRIIHVRVRGWRTKTVGQLACTPTTPPPPAAASSSAPAAFTPAPVAPIEPRLPSLQPPLNLLPPAISGGSREGDVLTAASGIWSGVATSFSYQWLRCDVAGDSCAPIPGAASSNYGLVAPDVAHTLRVTVIAANAAGSSAASSAPTQPVSALLRPPVNTAVPAISGSPQHRRTLVHVDGAWANEPTSETDQWLQCDGSGSGCQPIPGATSETYVPGRGDVGYTLRVQETASNAAGSSAPASSAPSAVVTAEQPPTNTSLPAIGGVARQGHTLTASTGTWTGSPAAFSYEWARCDSAGANCAPIGLATTSVYTATEADVGGTLRVSVTASNAAGTSAPATSEPSGVVAAAEQPPTNTALPAINGVAQQGQTLSASPGGWTGSPTAYSYEWRRCDSAGASCAPIASTTASSYSLAEADVGSTLRVVVTASNAAGPSAPATSAPSEVVTAAEQPPTNTGLPSISGVAQEGKTLSASAGGWTGSPSAFSYAWLRCDSAGANCAPIAAATASSYKVAEVDVGKTLRVVVTASNAAGSSAPATSAPSGVVTAAEHPPTNTSPPAISGVAQEGQTLTASAGSWTGSPTAFGYGWLRCDSAGANCAPIVSATASSYKVAESDVGKTLRVVVTASNAAGPSPPATSTQTAVVIAAEHPPANTSPPTISGFAQQGQTLTASPGSWTGSPTAFGYEWLRCDPAGANCAPIVSATNSSYKAAEVDAGKTLRVAVTASNAAGSSAPASSAPSEVVVAAEQPPTNTSPPTISGVAQEGKTLSASAGSWTGAPSAFSYEWLRCDSAGTNCVSIAAATSSSYSVAEVDVGKTLRVAVTASNAAGSSAPASSTQTVVVTTAESIHHLEYVLVDGSVSVYDMDHEYSLVRTISLPQTNTASVRGVTVAPSSHLMFVSYGGDGSINHSGNGSVLAYDLVTERVVWAVNLNTGIDSGMVSPDGSKIYMPDGESTPGSPGIWKVLSSKNGEVISTIAGGAEPHNTVASADGRYVYMGGRGYNFLDAYETATGKVKEIGPLVSSVRPFTVNGSNTLAFTTATEFDGFQVSSITTGHVLFTVKLAEFPKGFPFTTASHGIGISPDETHLYVLDAVHKEVQAFNIEHVREGVAPAPLWAQPVAGLSGEERSCAYDCTRGGWIQLSTDGRFIFVGDSGEVIEAVTHKVIATLPTLLNSKKSIEVDWQGGVPVATSGRTGVGSVP